MTLWSVLGRYTIVLCVVIVMITAGQESLSILLEKHLTNPKNVKDLQNLAIGYANAGDLSHAAIYFDKLGELTSSPEPFFNAGLVHLQIEDKPAAMRAFMKCGKINFRPCLIKLASLYRDDENYNEVQKYLQLCIKLDPKQPDAYGYLADTYNNLKQFKLAIEYYKKALSFGPNMAIMISLGDTYLNVKDYDNALEMFRRVLQGFKYLSKEEKAKMRLSVEFQALIGFYFSAIEIGYWKNFEFHENLILTLANEYNIGMERSGSQSISHPPNPLSPYWMLFFQSLPSIHTKISSQWASRLLGNNNQNDGIQLLGHNVTKRNGALKIGYLSRRFHDYPGTQMMIRIFGSHNRSNVEVATIANGPNDSSKYREYIQNTSDFLIDISSKPLLQGVEMIHSLELDVLIDYDGLHDFNSIKHIGKIQGPLKVSWLGYAGPLGMGNKFGISTGIDYIIGDRAILPPDLAHTAQYTEKIIYLPGSYQPQDDLRGEGLYEIDNPFNLITDRDSSIYKQRYSFLESLSLSDYNDRISDIANNLWLICFNRLSKITPDAFDDWMRIMRRSKDSILILMFSTNSSVRAIENEALARGVQAKRILFIPKLNMYDYRRLLSLGDLFLDTRNYNAHTVATDGMQEGLPLITIPGTTFASRVASSLNSAAGLESVLNCDNRKHFEDTSVGLLKSGNSIQSIKQLLFKAKGKCLFNSTKFAKKLEYSYQAITDIKELYYERLNKSHEERQRSVTFHIFRPAITKECEIIE